MKPTVKHRLVLLMGRDGKPEPPNERRIAVRFKALQRPAPKHERRTT